MHTVLRRVVVALGVVIVVLPTLPSLAQTYPLKTVRLVVPVAAGGGADGVARILGTRLSEIWKQPVIVENRPGANSILGADLVVKSPPDGYTLLVTGSGAISLNPVVVANLPHDPLRDLVPITLLVRNPFVLVMTSALPVQNFQGLLDHLRANPGKLNHAAGSASSILSAELLRSLAKVDFVDVNYKGSALAAGATMAGDTQLSILDPGSAITAARGGRVRILAVTSPQRSKLQPDVPTIAESGVPGYASQGWVVFLAPAKTPMELVRRINADAKAALQASEAIAKIEGLGFEVLVNAQDAAERELLDDSAKWAKLARERALKFE